MVIVAQTAISLIYTAESCVTGRSRWRFHTSLLKNDYSMIMLNKNGFFFSGDQ